MSTQQANRRQLLQIGYTVLIILLVSCNLLHKAKDQLPPGLAYLNQAPAGHGFEAFLEESTVQSELFRRRLLVGSDPNFASVNLIAEAILKFQQQASHYLSGHKDIESFNLSKKMIIDAVTGKEHISSCRAYSGFNGKWYGLWDKMSVDHHWSEIVELDKPRSVQISGGKPVWIRSYQYCRVGDGYGLNMIATQNPDLQPSCEFKQNCSSSAADLLTLISKRVETSVAVHHIKMKILYATSARTTCMQYTERERTESKRPSKSSYHSSAS